MNNPLAHGEVDVTAIRDLIDKYAKSIDEGGYRTGRDSLAALA